MNYPESRTRVSEYRADIAALRQKIRSVQQTCEPELVTDYELGGQDGSTKLSELFGAHETLFVVLNMGRSCPILHVVGRRTERRRRPPAKSRGVCCLVARRA